MSKEAQAEISSSSEVDAEVYEETNYSLWRRLKGKARLQVNESRMAPGTKWSNKDLDPVEPEYRTWRTYNFVTYWISDAFAVSNWRIGSSLIAIGLSWKLALVAVVIGNFITALVVTFNGLIGARLHIPFTVQARSAYGFYFAYVIIVFRIVISVFWYGIGTYTGAECVQSMIFAIWPRFRNVPNQLPESANITTAFMISYFIYFLICLPFHYIPPHQVRWFFTFKSIVTPIAGFAIIGWIVKETGGGRAIFTQGNEVHGPALGWAMMNGIYAMIGNFATLGVNMNDFARYSKKPNSPYVQLIVIPIVFIIMMLFGIIGANGSKILFGELLWDPLLIVDNWTSRGGRAAAFFCALAFLIAFIGVNISANSISVATDLSALLPKYINIRRGQFICAVIGAWAMTPWNILVSAGSLIDFMSGYTIWLAPISGILIADYYFVHQQVLSVPDMYRPNGIYRAAVSFLVGFVPLLPGFAKSVNPKLNVGDGPTHFYYLGYFYGFLVAGGLHILLSRAFPAKETMIHKNVPAVEAEF
ncbi:putative permease [Lachnellula suecica]|uniref:Putative permease n=1 Tax=Lachnellula suecica TaxID=602035 RepID=A0A8T9CHT7_9HELO|nr:putative permease [Lachnellula suecica]